MSRHRDKSPRGSRTQKDAHRDADAERADEDVPTIQQAAALFMDERFAESARSFWTIGAREGWDATLLWLCILSLLRGGLDDDIQVAAPRALEISRSNPWVNDVLSMLLGQMEGAELLARAADESQRVHAHYYVGARRLLDGDRDAAIQHLRTAAAAGRRSIESQLAGIELARLESDEPQPETCDEPRGARDSTMPKTMPRTFSRSSSSDGCCVLAGRSRRPSRSSSER